MNAEEKEYNTFIAEITEKALSLQEKYNKLSDNNKKRFLLYIEPLVRASGTIGFMEQVNILFK